MLTASWAVEHYEITRYGSLREWAKVLSKKEPHVALTEILDKDNAANNKLTNLAVPAINK
jgi:ferritin-like metal-binding protein YciE